MNRIKKVNELVNYNELEDKMFEMANIKQERTGLSVGIWISTKMSNHGPRIKAQGNYSDKVTPDELFVVTIEDDPKIIGDIGSLNNQDINSIIYFVKNNKDTLLDYWYERESDIVNVINKFKKNK